MTPRGSRRLRGNLQKPKEKKENVCKDSQDAHRASFRARAHGAATRRSVRFGAERAEGAEGCERERSHAGSVGVRKEAPGTRLAPRQDPSGRRGWQDGQGTGAGRCRAPRRRPNRQPAIAVGQLGGGEAPRHGAHREPARRHRHAQHGVRPR